MKFQKVYGWCYSGLIIYGGVSMFKTIFETYMFRRYYGGGTYRKDMDTILYFLYGIRPGPTIGRFKWM